MEEHWTQLKKASIFFFQAEDGIRDKLVTGVQTCALPICLCNFLTEFIAGRAATQSPCYVFPETHPKNGRMGLLRRQDAPSAARQIWRHRGYPNTDYLQSKGARRRGCAARAGRAVASRHLQGGYRQGPRRAHPYRTHLCRRSRTGRCPGNKDSYHSARHSLCLQWIWTRARIFARRLSLPENEDHPAG